jgi:hypothetical protein
MKAFVQQLGIICNNKELKNETAKCFVIGVGEKENPLKFTEDII